MLSDQYCRQSLSESVAAQCESSKKTPHDYKIPDKWRDNTAHRIQSALAALALKGTGRPANERMQKGLARMQLDNPSGLKERLYRALLVAVLEE